MVKKRLKIFASAFLSNPVFTAALVCAVLFYSNSVKLRDRNRFLCLVPLEQVASINGQLVSNPVKSSAGKEIYSADFKVEKVFSKNGGEFSSKGNVKILIPSAMVEKFYPGKLFTASRKSKEKNFIFENGNTFFLEGSFTQGELSFFSVKNARAGGFEKSLKGKIQYFRGLCRLQFKRLMYGWGNAGGLLLALLSGSREYTESATRNAFTDAGLAHILALSGMHLSLFGGIAFFFGNRITRRNLADFFQLAAVFFFVWFAGLSPSLFRAMLSSIIVFVNSSLRMKRFKGITVLSATFLLHACIFPEHLKSAAFMLSYGALAGIMSFGQIFKILLGKRLFPKLSAGLSESAGAQLFTAPVTLSFFGKLMPVGIIAGMVVSPLVTFFLYAGLTGTLMCLILPFLSGVFSAIMNIIYFILKEIVLFFAKAPQIRI